MKIPRGKRWVGLKTATPEEIDELKLRFPNGKHITHFSDGSKLPYNGVFCEGGKIIK